MQRVQALIEQVAPTDSTVLILGETGTGKELVAQGDPSAQSAVQSRMMVTVNCGSLPTALIESELFGREKGAYTGALSRQAGRFELAHGSPVPRRSRRDADRDPEPKLLRVLQDGTYERLGNPVNLKADVRASSPPTATWRKRSSRAVSAATCLPSEASSPIVVPPLRGGWRVSMLTWRFVSEFGQRMGRKISRIARSDMERLETYDWPGNVRELRNVIERAMITTTGTVLDLSQLTPARLGPLNHPPP